MNSARFGLPALTVVKLQNLFANYPLVEKAVLYGSRAKGNYKNGSDIDLTLYGDGLGLNELLTINSEIDDLLLPYSIDLSLFERLKTPSLREHIERVGIVFYERVAATEKGDTK